uniref:Uncharacterized protein n=1 Tax=Arundo donax TaxID=35708 RepID=A0A0A8YMD9_ARUDO
MPWFVIVCVLLFGKPDQFDLINYQDMIHILKVENCLMTVVI